MKIVLNLDKVVANKSTIRNLKAENEQLLKEVFSEVKELISNIKNDSLLFKDLTRAKLISIIKNRCDDRKSVLFNLACDYYEHNLSINLNLVSVSLLKDLIKFYKKELISKNQIAKCNTSLDYIELRKFAVAQLNKENEVEEVSND